MAVERTQSKALWSSDEELQVDIVSAEKAVFSGRVKLVVAPAVQGELGILPRHTPLLTTIKPGAIRLIYEDGHEESYYASGGFMEVQPQSVTILADTVVRAAEIDEERAMAAKARAEAIIARKQFDHYTVALVELSQALAQLSTLRRWRQEK